MKQKTFEEKEMFKDPSGNTRHSRDARTGAQDMQGTNFLDAPNMSIEPSSYTHTKYKLKEAKCKAKASSFTKGCVNPPLRRGVRVSEA